MSIIHVTGDPQLTQAQTLAIGHNARARAELGAFETTMLYVHPAAFSAYSKACRRERIKSGGYFIWRESKPLLAFLVVRESSVGATRLRYVQSALMGIARDYRLEGIKSLAIAPLGSSVEWPEIQQVIEDVFKRSTLPVVVYDVITPGVRAEQAEENSS